MKKCAIEDCGNPVKGRGWCKMHYARWRRHGDPLFTLTAADGEPERFLRETVLAHNGAGCLIWPYTRDGYGYGRIWWGGKMESVHRIVCERADGPPCGREVAHECGNGHLGCVSPLHVRWKTHAENMADKARHGTNTGPRRAVRVQELRSI